MQGLVDAEEWAEARRICLRVARRFYGRDPAEAEDIAQDAVLRAWRAEGTLRDTARRREWLAAIARNEALRHYARRRPEPVETIESGEGAEDERVLSAIDRADLERALARLNDPDRLLLKLRYIDDLTQAAIAALLDVPEGTVKIRLHRARVKLEAALKRSV